MQKDRKMRPKESTNRNRRWFLRTAGASAAAITLPIESVGAVVSDSPSGLTVTIKRPQNKPISLEKANEVRKRANGQFRDKTGSTRDLGYTRVEASHETDVFSMVVHIDEAGQPATYLGSTLANKPTNESTVQRLHERAEAFRQNAEDSVANVSQFADETSDYVSTARAGLEKDWRAVDSYNWHNYYQDYGYMQTGTDAGAYQTDNYFYSGAFSSHDNSPGVNEFSDSDFRQYRGWLTQDHDVYQGGGITLDEYAPQGDDTGDTEYSGTISVGLSGVNLGISATYDPTNVERYDDSVFSSNVASWRWKYNNQPYWDGATMDPDTFKPNSYSYSESSPSDGDILFTVENEARWYDPYTGYDTDRYGQKKGFFYDSA